VPEPTTGFAALGVWLHPAMLSTVMLMSPRSEFGGGKGWTWLMNACMNPTTVTAVAGQVEAVWSMIGIVTIELLVVTRFPVCGPLWTAN